MVMMTRVRMHNRHGDRSNDWWRVRVGVDDETVDSNSSMMAVSLRCVRVWSIARLGHWEANSQRGKGSAALCEAV